MGGFSNLLIKLNTNNLSQHVFASLNILINYLIHGFINVKTGYSQYSFSCTKITPLITFLTGLRKQLKIVYRDFALHLTLKYLDDKVEKYINNF